MYNPDWWKVTKMKKFYQIQIISTTMLRPKNTSTRVKYRHHSSKSARPNHWDGGETDKTRATLFCQSASHYCKYCCWLLQYQPHGDLGISWPGSGWGVPRVVTLPLHLWNQRKDVGRYRVKQWISIHSKEFGLRRNVVQTRG